MLKAIALPNNIQGQDGYQIPLHLKLFPNRKLKQADAIPNLLPLPEHIPAIR